METNPRPSAFYQSQDQNSTQSSDKMKTPPYNFKPFYQQDYFSQDSQDNNMKKKRHWDMSYQSLDSENQTENSEPNSTNKKRVKISQDEVPLRQRFLSIDISFSQTQDSGNSEKNSHFDDAQQTSTDDSPNLEHNPIDNFQIRKDNNFCIKQNEIYTKRNFYDLKNQYEKNQEKFEKFENFEIREKFQQHLAAKNAIIVGDKILENSSIPLKIKCFMKHIFEISLNDIENNQWCQKCQKHLEKTQVYAEQNQGQVLNTHFESQLYFECYEKHQWKIYYQNYWKKWCPVCEKAKQEKIKLQLEEEKKKREEILAQKQQKLFEEAKQRVYEKDHSNSIEMNQIQFKKKVLTAYENIQDDINKLASKHAREYQQKFTDSNIPLRNLHEIYKILLIPEDILKMYLLSLDINELKGEFRKIARYIHPDKNNHQKSIQAFQKLNKIYNLALENLNQINNCQ